MKTMIFSLLIANLCFSQTIQFEDKILETKLLKEFQGVLKTRTSNVDLNNNGNIEISEALNVQEIFLELDSCLTTLNDLKHFKNLVSLSIRNSLFKENIGSLTLNLNSFTELQFLTVETACINKIDVSNCPKLQYLSCLNYTLNPIYIDGISDCVNLEEFQLGNYSENFLDLSSNSKLREFGLIGNSDLNNGLVKIIFPKENNISFLFLKNIKLEYFNIEGFKKIKEIVIKDSNIKELNLENLNYFESLSCSNNQFELFILKDNPNLRYAYLYNNTIKNITFDVTKSLKLIESFVPQNLYQDIIKKNPELKKIIKPALLNFQN